MPRFCHKGVTHFIWELLGTATSDLFWKYQMEAKRVILQWEEDGLG